NFVFVDPFGHSDIDVKTLRKIAALSMPDKYLGTSFIRRPEIMFTFMTSGMQQSMSEAAIESIDRFFGNRLWRERVARNKNDGAPMYEGVLEALMFAMNDLYAISEQTNQIYEVRTPRGQLVYT